MTCNETLIEAPPEAVFGVLTDARRYPEWVLGASRVRSVTAGWPDPGSKFRHQIGLPPFLLRDSTSVVAMRADRELTLWVGISVFGSATVQLRLEPEDDAACTRVELIERPVDGPVRWLSNPLQDAALWFRNEWSLLRLKRLTEKIVNGTARPAPVPTEETA